MNIRKVFFGICLTLICAGCVTALSPLQRRTIEARDLEGTFDDAFKATLQVFQDFGYIVKSSDYQSGVIQGETGYKKNIFFGTMTNVEITATIEQFGAGRVKERISLVKKVKSPSEQGILEDSRIVDDPELFQRMYEAIQKEMFIRQNLAR
ncbi:MAG: hypothetical protein JSW40_08185 [Candidatus Omnitrophota bacterium]|nr:MAG: hypothetical protein JSW40_08185 [Candidatus Omnitrophota bacterium]